MKQHLAAVRMLLNWLVVTQVIPMNPAAAGRGPKYVAKRGKTTVLTPEEARHVLDSIDTGTIIGLRDRAIIGVMVYSFARVGALVRMSLADFYQQGRRPWFRLHEKAGKRHEVPAHHNAAAYLEAYLRAAGVRGALQSAPLFRTFDRKGQLSVRPMTRFDVFEMIKRRARHAELSASVCCHTFRATGITAYLANGGSLENAQAIAAHESPRTTKLYDRIANHISLEEVERIGI